MGTEFNFIDDEEEVEDDEFLDLSDLLGPKKEEPEVVEVAGLGFSFEEEVPAARSITDPEVKERASRSRKRSVSNRDYTGRRQSGWSMYCAHKDHLPNLCERDQDAGKVTCTCPCHSERGYVRQEPESLQGSDDEEFVFIFD